MQTLGELKNIAAGLVQRSSSDTYKDENIEDYINLSLQLLYNKYDFFDELKGQFDFTSVSSTALYFMPSDFQKANRLYDITNNKLIQILPEETYFDGNIANIADAIEGDVNVAYPKEVVGVKVQVSTSGDTVKIKSSSTSDVNTSSSTQRVRVEGYLDSDLTIVGYENISLNGTTEVDGIITFFKITHFSKSLNTVGFVSLLNSSSTTLGVLGQNERVAFYKAFRLGLIPDDSSTIFRVLYKKKFNKLVEDEDYPFVEADDYLIFHAVSLAMQQDKESAQGTQLMQQKANEALVGILLNQKTKLGTSYTSSITSGILQAHRS